MFSFSLFHFILCKSKIINITFLTIIAVGMLFPFYRIHSVIFMMIWLIYTVQKHTQHIYLLLKCDYIVYFFWYGEKWLHIHIMWSSIANLRYIRKEKNSVSAFYALLTKIQSERYSKIFHCAKN